MTPPIRALILAAGRGQRMRPLTDHTPKPLLLVKGRPLIEWHLQALARAGVQEVVINTAWLEEQFPLALGDGARWGLRLHYSMEGRDHGGALETAGGMATALPYLSPGGTEPFWVVSGDIYAPGFTFAMAEAARFANSDDWGHLWMVDNPPGHEQGDFILGPDGRLAERLSATSGARLTYANLALMRPAIVQEIAPGTRAALGPCLHQAASANRLSGQRWSEVWENVGTPAQWQALQ